MSNRLSRWLIGPSEAELRASNVPAIAVAGPPPGPPPPPPAATGEASITAATPRDFAGWPVGLALTRDEAMAVPVLANVRHLLAAAVSSMPLERFRGADRLEPGWCARPNPAEAPNVTWSWVLDDLLFRGQSTLVVLARDYYGFPTAMCRVEPGRITYEPRANAQGTLLWQPVWWSGVEVPEADVIVVAGPHEGLCHFAATTIRQALDLESAAARSALTPLPAMELHQVAGETLTPAEALELVNTWEGSRQRSSTAYTPETLEAKVHGFSAADQQQVEGRQYQATQAARSAGVNPVIVSAAQGSSSAYVYANLGELRSAFLDDVADNYLRSIEARLSADDVVPRGQTVRFDRDDYSHPDPAGRLATFAALTAAGLPVDAAAAVAGLDLTADQEVPA